MPASTERTDRAADDYGWQYRFGGGVVGIAAGGIVLTGSAIDSPQRNVLLLHLLGQRC
jgi:hypothetical protein